MKRLIGPAIAAALAMGGCTPDYVQQDESQVLVIVAAVNGGAPLDSDVIGDSGVEEDEVSMDVAIRSKNPRLEVPDYHMAVVFERYEVRYYRSDGRNTEGVDVPYRISGNMTVAMDAKESGTDPVTIEVVRRQAKLEPPLINLRNRQSGLGGSGIITCFAEITIHGRTIVGKAVKGTGRLQIDFADFPG